MEKWVVEAKRADFNEIGKNFGIDPVIARIIRNRGLTEMKDIGLYLNGTLEDLPDPGLLLDVRKAARIVTGKINEGKRIRIIGDYDIDGVTATYILKTGLKRAGAVVDTYIPDRVADGYGIHEHLIRRAVEDGIDTIVTCDNGIAAWSEIALAKSLGMTVIVTDHHEVPFEDTPSGRIFKVPEADAVVNPKQENCPYPNKNICGAVVCFKFIQVLYEMAGIPAEDLDQFVEIAAIATVGDVMDLLGENRILVKEGLKRLPSTKNAGLRALINACGLAGRPLSAYHIGFVIGPCINASGRLRTAALSLALLETEDPDQAADLAEKLRDLNEERKLLTDQGKEEAIRQIEETEAGRNKVLVLFLPEAHESIAGIIAGRIREKYNKPVFILTRGEVFIKGSGRSIEAYSMYEEISRCADLLIQFGGHPMAAGLSLEEKNIDAFRSRLNELCTLTEEDLIPKIRIDVPMPLNYITTRLIGQLSLLEPYGKANAKPVFACKGLKVLYPRVIGEHQNAAKMTLMDDSGVSYDAIYFGEAMEFVSYARDHKTVMITYYPEINTFRGREYRQIVIMNYC